MGDNKGNTEKDKQIIIKDEEIKIIKKNNNEKYKIFLLIGLTILFMQFAFGAYMLISGINYKNYNEKDATEMLNIIKENDKNYYKKLTDTNNINISYMEDFKKNYEIRGDKTKIISGGIICIFSIILLLTITSYLIITREKKNEDDELIVEKGVQEEDKF